VKDGRRLAGGIQEGDVRPRGQAVGRFPVNGQNHGNRPRQAVGQPHFVQDAPKILFPQKAFQGAEDARGDILDIAGLLGVKRDRRERRRLLERFVQGRALQDAVDQLSAMGLNHQIAPRLYFSGDAASAVPGDASPAINRYNRGLSGDP
jgi:hypothetical protein